MGKESLGIRKEAAKLAWYSRGSLQYTDALSLSSEERALFGELVTENIETTKKSGLPFF